MFVNHNAGLDGNGNSSYIDNVILRDRDANTSWTNASDGTLEERRYYCQNWRADVSAIITSGGVMVEWAKYSPYGIPFGLPGADTDSDGDCDATDISNFDSVPSYDVRYDIDLDGDNDATDKSIAQTYYQGTTLGWDILSSNPDTGTGNRKGYAGYEYHEAVSLYHIRNRILHPELGRWTRRDPLGYVDGVNVYEYVGSKVLYFYDSDGLSSCGSYSCQSAIPGIPGLQKGFLSPYNCVGTSDDLAECYACVLKWYSKQSKICAINLKKGRKACKSKCRKTGQYATDVEICKAALGRARNAHAKCRKTNGCARPSQAFLRCVIKVEEGEYTIVECQKHLTPGCFSCEADLLTASAQYSLCIDTAERDLKTCWKRCMKPVNDNFFACHDYLSKTFQELKYNCDVTFPNQNK